MIHQSSAIKILVSQSLLSTYAICVLSALSVLSLLRHYLGGARWSSGTAWLDFPKTIVPLYFGHLSILTLSSSQFVCQGPFVQFSSPQDDNTVAAYVSVVHLQCHRLKKFFVWLHRSENRPISSQKKKEYCIHSQEAEWYRKYHGH